MTKAMIIAVDGSAASGKGTLSKRLASHFDIAHLDTGSLYRALALQLLNTGMSAEFIDKNQASRESLRLDLGLCNTPEIRNDRVALIASKVAALPEVRANLLAFQRSFANNPPHGNGAVLDGRDIADVEALERGGQALFVGGGGLVHRLLLAAHGALPARAGLAHAGLQLGASRGCIHIIELKKMSANFYLKWK